MVALAALAAIAGSCSPSPRPGAGPAASGSRRLYGGPPVHPPERSRVGFKWDWPRVERYAPFLAEASGGPTFYEVVWCEVEPRPGRRDWSTPDEVVRSAQALGYSVLLKLRVGSCWATGGAPGRRSGRGAKTASAPPTDLAAYAGFVRSAAARYSARGVSVFAVENEVNSPGKWAGTPAEYEQLVVTASEAVRSAAPGARVLDSGISSTAYGTGLAARLLAAGRGEEAVANYRRYYARRFPVRSELPEVTTADDLRAVVAGERAARDGAFVAATARLAHERRIDAWQLHFYEPWENVGPLIDHVRRLLPPAFPIEAWETGVFRPHQLPDEPEQAAEATKVVASLLARQVAPVIWLPLAYNPEGRHEEEVRLGLLEPSGRVRAAGRAVTAMARTASQASSTMPVEIAGLQGLELHTSASATFVLWSDRPAVLTGPPPSAARASVVGGGPLHWGSGGLPLGPTPVLVQGGPEIRLPPAAMVRASP